MYKSEMYLYKGNNWYIMSGYSLFLLFYGIIQNTNKRLVLKG